MWGAGKGEGQDAMVLKSWNHFALKAATLIRMLTCQGQRGDWRKGEEGRGL